MLLSPRRGGSRFASPTLLPLLLLLRSTTSSPSPRRPLLPPPRRLLSLRQQPNVPAPPPPSSDSSNNNTDAFLQMGTCIRTLRAELDHFLDAGLVSTAIYHRHIEFADAHYTRTRVHGRQAYLCLAAAVRAATCAWFHRVEFAVVGMRQRVYGRTGSGAAAPPDPEDDDVLGTLTVRVVVSGVSRWDVFRARLLPALVPPFLLRRRRWRGEPNGADDDDNHAAAAADPLGSNIPATVQPHDVPPQKSWETTCVYAFDRATGLVKYHWIERITPRPRVWRVGEWIGWQGGSSMRVHRDGEAAEPGVVGAVEPATSRTTKE